MSSFIGITCGDIRGRQDSELLPGVLKPGQQVFYDSGYNKESSMDYKDLDYYVPEEFKIDGGLQAYVSENGAVVDAYYLSRLSPEEFEKAKRSIISEQQILYPEYEFELLPGSFPMDFRTDGEPEMSSHVLYLKNYKEIARGKREETVAKVK